jgi:hypothetical protein
MPPRSPLEALVRRDGGRLAAALTDTVRLRALLPAVWSVHSRDAVVARFAGWFADFGTVELMSAAGNRWPTGCSCLPHSAAWGPTAGPARRR